MREIKFKYIFHHKKDGYYQLEVYTLDAIQDSDFHNELKCWKLDGYELVDILEYTTINDKEGNEIYDGSILHSTSQLYSDFGKKATGTYDDTYKKIIWMEDTWGYEVIKSNSMVIGSKLKGIKIAAQYGIVIGDIYSNHELLTKE